MVGWLPWLLVLLALLGASWMVYDATWSFDGDAIEREGSDEDDPFFDGEDTSWEETWDEAPRLVGAPGAVRARDPKAADAAGGSTVAGTATDGPDPVGAVVRFGGTVKGPDGRPLGGIAIALQAKGGALLSAETKESGRFAIEIPAGRYDLLFKGEGVGGLALAGYLVDGASGVDIEFELEPLHRLSLALMRESQAVEGAKASIVPRTGPGGEALETDASGIAVFSDLVAGSYDLVVTMKEREDVRQRVDLKRDTTLKIDVPRGVVIHGRVEGEEDGTRVESARVAASVRLPTGTWVTSTADTDANGEYEVEVPKGYVGRFTVVADDYAAWPPKKKIRQVLKSLRGIAKGRPTEENVRLTRGLFLTGTVKDAEGQGIPGVELSFKPRRSAALRTTSGEDGAFELSGIRSEAYDVVVLSEGYFPERALRVRVPKLTPGDSFAYDVTVLPTIEVQGAVVHPDSKPAAGARVWITGGGRLLRAAHNAGRELETFTDAGGLWRLRDLPPSQGVAARASLGTLEARPRGFRTNELPDKPLKLVLEPTVRLEGRVMDMATRTPVARARVTIRPSGSPGGRSSRQVTTDAEGRFESLELIPGTWDLTPSKSGYLPAEAREEVLATSDDEVSVELLLDPGLVLAGRVLDAQGRPLRNAKIRVWGTTREGKSARRDGRTTANGNFRLTGFTSGQYTLRARRSGYRNATVKGLQGGETRLQITMKPRTR